IIEEAYPGRFVTTEDTIRAWIQLIGDLDAEAAISAVLDHCRTGEFPPTVAAIRRRVAEHYSAVPSAEDAYEEAREAAARRWTPPNGPMPEFSHPLIRRSVEILGIEVMAMTTEPSVVAAQFRRVYE